MNHLFVSPHPDDTEIALGGHVYQLIKQGHSVTIAVCTGQGDLRMVHTGETVAFERRVAEQKKAAQALGKPSLHWMGLAGASRFDEVPQSRFVTAFDQLFHLYHAVYLPLPSYNDDHRRVWEAGVAAFRPGKVDRVNLYAYEQSFSNALGEQLHGREFGKRYLGISQKALNAKMKAVACHVSQMGDREDSIYGGRGIEVMAQLRGMEVGLQYAELLYVIREVCN